MIIEKHVKAVGAASSMEFFAKKKNTKHGHAR